MVSKYSYGVKYHFKIVLWLIASTLVSHCELYSEVLMYILAVINGRHCTPLLSSLINNAMYVLNSVGTLLILTHAAIQVVYCHYMLTPFVECLRYIKL